MFVSVSQVLIDAPENQLENEQLDYHASRKQRQQIPQQIRGILRVFIQEEQAHAHPQHRKDRHSYQWEQVTRVP